MSSAPGRTPAALIDSISIAIVGAGVGGLTLALALRHHGFPSVTVYDTAADVPDTPGWTLELNANGSRVLHALGLEEALSTSARQVSFAYTRAGGNGFLLTQRPLGDFSTTRYGAPCYLVDGNALRRLLRDHCRERGVTLRFACKVRDVDTERGTLTLDSGEAERFDAVVAASGRTDPLAAIVCPTPASTEPPLRILRARCGNELALDAIVTWIGPERFCVQYPHGRERTDLLLVSRDNEPADDPVATLQRDLAGSHRQLLESLDAVEEAYAVADDGARLRDYWYAGRLALLGDACHALTPALPFGAAVALEDAWVLAVMMERWEESPHEGYPEYQRYRLARVKKLLRGSAELLDELLLPAGRATITRNLRWSLASRYLPEISMARLDWLYGYDCIKGFS